MHWIDIVIVIVIGGFGFLGWKNGLIKWVATFAGAIVGIVLAGRYYEAGTDFFPVDTEFDDILAFAIIFGITLIIFWFVASLIKKILNLLLLGWIDRLIGTLIGLIVAAFSVSAIVSITLIIPIESIRSTLAESNLIEPLLEATSIIHILLPTQFDQIDNILKEGLKSGAYFKS